VYGHRAARIQVGVEASVSAHQIVVKEDFREMFEGLTLDQRLGLYVTAYPDGVKVYRSGREVCLNTSNGRREYARRRLFVYQAYNQECRLCGRFCMWEEATVDHREPRGMGGSGRDDRPATGAIWPAHYRCNGLRGSRRLGEGPCAECGYEIVLVDGCLKCGARW
jgi:hypothetical protein